MNNHEMPNPSPEEIDDALNQIKITTAESEVSLADLVTRRKNLLLYAGTDAWTSADRQLLENLDTEIERKRGTSTHKEVA